MKNFTLKFYFDNELYFVTEKAFTENGAYRKAIKKIKKNRR
jgi:hypothetical protein